MKRYKPGPPTYNAETPAQLVNLLISVLPHRRTRRTLRRFNDVLRFVEAHLERSFDIHKTAYTEASRAAIRSNVAFLKRDWGAENTKKRAAH